MIIQSCTFTIHFPQSNRIREHFFELENHFTDFQKPFTLVPLPPDAPVEIPRIVAATQHGHSQLTICGNNAQLNTKFDGEFATDIKRCVEYVQNKCASILSSLAIINEDTPENPRFYFSGITMTLSLDESDGIDNPINFISNNYLKAKVNLPVDEAQFRLALVVEDTYYVNFMVQNNRIFYGVPDERGSFAGLKNMTDRLQITLDINDRYAFNHRMNYFSSSNAVANISQLIEKFASNYVSAFVKNGEIDYV